MPTQEPIGSNFDAATTATEVVQKLDLHGQIAIVTGGYSGIGLETSRALANAGATVIVPARDTTKAAVALRGIDRVELETLDLSNPASIDAFAQKVISAERPISILINNAGIMASPLMRNSEGHEAQFAINHLGHFRLTVGLWPALKAAEGARVVSVSSRGHQIAGINFDDIDFRSRPYEKWIAYGQSKTANALFAVALDRRGIQENIRAFSLHPGQILTDLARHLSTEEIAGFDAFDSEGRPRIDPSRGMKTVQQGAATSVWCTTSPLLSGMGGVYCEDCDIAVIQTGDIGQRGVSPWATDSELAERLWQTSEKMTGMSLL